MNDKLLAAKEVADIVGVKPKQLTSRLRHTPGFPKPADQPGRPKWHKSAIEAYLERINLNGTAA